MELPSPFYCDEQVTIYCADCMQVLPHIERCDLLLTDPPYGIGDKWAVDGAFGTAGGRLWSSRHSWDAATADEAVKLAILRCDRAIIWGGNYYNLPPSRGYLVWDKMQSSFSMADSELAWCSWGCTPKTFRYARAQLASEGKVHPTQKPLGLMRFCLSVAGDKVRTVLDPFMGSGTTLLAAKLEGKHAIGIEVDERFCEIACRRLAQGVLF